MILFIITILLLFVDTTFEKAIANMIFIIFNMVLIMIVGYVFSAVDIYGYDSSGEIVHNVLGDMYPFTYLYLVFFYINLMLMVYCVYLFIKKPWDEFVENEEETIYYNQGF
jgi:membrane-bound metal-dependent hydrolase YbcI (DUF457 family)